MSSDERFTRAWYIRVAGEQKVRLLKDWDSLKAGTEGTVILSSWIETPAIDYVDEISVAFDTPTGNQIAGFTPEQYEKYLEEI